jgi:hypothetical protein
MHDKTDFDVADDEAAEMGKVSVLPPRGTEAISFPANQNNTQSDRLDWS